MKIIAWVRSWLARFTRRPAVSAPAPMPPAPEPELELEPPPPPEPAPPPPALEPRKFRVRGKRVSRARDVWLTTPERKKHPSALRRPRKARAPTAEASEPEISEDGFDFSRSGVEEAGTFYFRGSLLNDLPKYFRSLRRLRGADPSTYDLISTVGMSLIPKRMVGILCDVPAYWRDPKQRPAFGAASFAEHMADTDEDNTLRLIYFKRLEVPPADIEPTNSETYEVGTYFDDENTEAQKKHRAPKWMRKHGFAVNYFVGVDDHGNAKLLKQLQIRHQHIHYRGNQSSSSNRGPHSHTNGSHTRRMKFTEAIPVKLWDYPEFLRSWYRDKDERNRQATDEEMAFFFARLFTLTASFCNANDTGVRISVKGSDGLAASFALDMKRSAYFFKDRDVVLTPEGKRARIFHVRRPHLATLKSGKTIARKMSFPGLRRFSWAGYEVHITVPGLHHKPLLQLMPDLMDYEAARAMGHKDLVRTKVFGEMLSKHLDRA